MRSTWSSDRRGTDRTACRSGTATPCRHAPSKALRRRPPMPRAPGHPGEHSATCLLSTTPGAFEAEAHRGDRGAVRRSLQADALLDHKRPMVRPRYQDGQDVAACANTLEVAQVDRGAPMAQPSDAARDHLLPACEPPRHLAVPLGIPHDAGHLDLPGALGLARHLRVTAGRALGAGHARWTW